jgi:O-acetyl-ADP-ribose deacetylase (regulator of RNase III)
VIHAVGPVWGSGDEEKKLAEAVSGALRIADDLRLASIALPAISTGIYGFPVQLAAGTILAAIQRYFQEHPDSCPRLVRIVLSDDATMQAFARAWAE